MRLMISTDKDNSPRAPRARWDGLTRFSFLLSFAAVATIIVIVITLLFAANLRRERTTYYATSEVSARETFKAFADNLDNLAQTTNYIFRARWYKHHRMTGNIYADEFNLLRRMEISEDLLARVTVLDYVSDILVITPSMNSVIGRQGWYNLSDFVDFYPETIRIDASDAKPVIQAASERYAVLTFTDFTSRKDAGVITLLIDRTAFGAYMKRLLPPTARARVSLAEQVLFDSLDDKCAIYVHTNGYPECVMTIGFPHYVLPSDSVWNLILMLIAALVLSAGLALLFTSRWISPLKRLLARLSPSQALPRTPTSAYAHLEAAFDHYETRVEQAGLEVKRLREEAARAVQAEKLLDLIQRGDADEAERVFPGFAQGLPCIMSLSGEPLPLDDALYTCSVRLGDDICTLRWYAEDVADDLTDGVAAPVTDAGKVSAAYASLRGQRERTQIAQARQETYAQVGELLTQYVDAHFTDASLSMTALADIFGMDASLTSKRFSSYTGMSYSSYIQGKRVAYASGLLRESNYTLAEIGELAGYPNYLTFKRAFKREHGMTPLSWRESQG